MHVFEFLAKERPATPVCVVYGTESFLKRLARERLCRLVFGTAEDPPYVTYDGDSCAWKDVLDELSTVSLFGGDKRLVWVEQADSFVARHRDRLEAYLDKPRSTGVLVLEVENWARNTRLYKRLSSDGLQIECKPPEKAAGKGKTLDVPALKKWLVDWAATTHDCKLQVAAADELIALVGPEFGLLDQSLAKLALFADGRRGVTPEMVREFVGGWRAQTIWELLDAAADGNTAAALEQLGHILEAGEHPVALFGQIAWSLRRFAAATRIYERMESTGQPPRMSEALSRAGFPHWNRTAMTRAEKQLKRLGRERAGRIYRTLLEADLALKGTHSSPQRARFVLEKMILELAVKKSANR